MSRFTTQPDGILLGRFEPIEADLLRLATTQLLEMLDSGAGDPQLAASDGIFGRLLPDAYRDDDEAAAEFRRFTATDLLDRKAQNAQVVLNSLGISKADADTPDTSADDDRQPVTVSLDPDTVQAWLRSLTDLRLTLADRLQISPDGVVHLAGDETPFLRELYEWLGMLQEELVYTIDV
ncbi:DUF2017 family protein [Cryobacterium sp. PH31-L1]|uniref:DUF2017 family protein n=1 Tax=Cryobacterium sp. PH31-L1 TaxID=3046199 RepID=UPI0024BA6BA7|nr:DUF2017 family protein [Cryobacterium sp. PH31-L1]MDJ0378159.1 DUF2017 family protein [Cryobacterium sp. PH31-L1]